MAKRKRKMDYEIKITKEGRGRGEGMDYKPLYNNQDVAPSSRTTRTRDEATGRQAIALSDQEIRLRKLMEYGGRIVKIKELYPIDLEESRALANTLGIKHPVDPKTGKMKPLVINILVTRRSKQGKEKTVAVQYVQSNALANRSVINQLELVRRWCVKQEYAFMIVTKEDLESIFVDNVCNLHNYLSINSWYLANATVNERIDLMSEFLVKSMDFEGSTRAFCTSFGKEYDMELGEVINLFKHLVANKVIKVDLKQVWDMSKSMIEGIEYDNFNSLVGRYKNNDTTECDL